MFAFTWAVIQSGFTLHFGQLCPVSSKQLKAKADNFYKAMLWREHFSPTIAVLYTNKAETFLLVKDFKTNSKTLPVHWWLWGWKGLHSGQDKKQKLNKKITVKHSWRNCKQSTLGFVSTAYWRKMVTTNEPKMFISNYLICSSFQWLLAELNQENFSLILLVEIALPVFYCQWGSGVRLHRASLEESMHYHLKPSIVGQERVAAVCDSQCSVAPHLHNRDSLREPHHHTQPRKADNSTCFTPLNWFACLPLAQLSCMVELLPDELSEATCWYPVN